MKILDKIISRHFETDNEGSKIFHPNSPIGKGFYLTTEELENQIRTYLKDEIIILVIVSIVCLAAIILHPSLITISLLILGEIILLVGGYIIKASLVKELPPVETRLTIKEKYLKLAKRQSNTRLWLGIAVLAFVIADMSRNIIRGRTLYFGIAVIVVFTIMIVLNLGMIIIKKKTN